MWAAVGTKTGKIYAMSNYKSTLFLRLQKEYKFKTLIDSIYPESLRVQKVK